MSDAEYNDMSEQFLSAGRRDSKGREIGYVVGLNNNGTKFAAWVQNTRRVKGEWKEFGVPQRAKYFDSQAEATRWAYSTARERIAKACG
jgi:hypothetical protein